MWRIDSGEDAGAPIVVTLQFDPAATTLFQRQREAHFPPALNRVPAHLTLFHVPDPDVYLRAARRTPLDHLLPRPGSLDEAVGLIAAIAGSESIFEDRRRIAMPDETVRFDTGTGTDRDKALLLHVLLERLPGEAGLAPGPLQTIITDMDSYVTGRELCISARTAAMVPGVAGVPLYRFGP